jgi:hypothetical protein
VRQGFEESGYSCKKQKKDVVDCENAEAQAPRDVSDGYHGLFQTKVQPQPALAVDKFEHVNLHFHLGAEHRSNGEYDVNVSQLHDPKALRFHEPKATIRPGYFCNLQRLNVRESQLTEYKFEACKDVHVGNTYEFHWVFSTGSRGTVHGDVVVGRSINIEDGLGGAFEFSMNPTVIVRAQVCTVVNDDSFDDSDFFLHWNEPAEGSLVRYVGSTTGASYNNGDRCSKVEVSWHVDQKCCIISAKSLDHVCARMRAHGMHDDVHPHSTRELVDKKLAADEYFKDAEHFTSNR